MKFSSCFIQGAALALLAGTGSTFGFAGSKLGKDMHDAVMMGYSSDLALDPGHFKAVMDSPKFGSPQAETVDVGSPLFAVDVHMDTRLTAGLDAN